MALYTVQAGNDGYRATAAFTFGTSSVTLAPGGARIGLFFTGLPLLTVFSQAVLGISGSATAAGTVRVYVVCDNDFFQPEVAPTKFLTGSRLPEFLPHELLLGEASLAAGAFTSFPLVLTTNPLGQSGPTPSLLPYLHHSLFSGVVPLEVEWASTSLGNLTFTFSEGGGAATLDTGTELPFLTGLDGIEYAYGNSRVAECPVTGKRDLRERWVRRGWDKALVDPSANDPADYVEKYVHYERPPLNDAG